MRQPSAAPSWPPLAAAGDLPAFLQDRLGFLLRMAEQHGDVVPLRLGAPTLLLRDPEDIRHVLEGKPFQYEKTPRLTGRRGRWLSGRGLLTSRMDESVPRRRLLQPAYAGSTIAGFGGPIATAVERCLERWPTEGTLDIGAAMMELALSIMALLLAGIDVRSLGGAKLARAVATRRRFLHGVFDSLLPLAEFLPTPERFAYARAQGHLQRFLRQAIGERRRFPGRFPDVLDLLVQARREDGTALEDGEILDEALTFALPGYETIGESLAWTLHLLSLHPPIATAVQQELATVLGDRDPGPGDLPRLDLLPRVIAESLRIYPPTWIFIRIANGPDVLPGGTRVAAGTKLYLCPWVSHRHPRWFPDPERFDPGRFHADALKGRPRYTYFPFGGGLRRCIGQALAQMELPLILARILRRYAVHPLPGQRVRPDPHITLTPKGGLSLRVVRRPQGLHAP